MSLGKYQGGCNLENTNKHTGANTGTLIYSERAKRRKKIENRKFYKNTMKIVVK